MATISIEFIIDQALTGNSAMAAEWLELEVERLGKRARYIEALLTEVGVLASGISCDACCLGLDDPSDAPAIWALLCATPAQRAQAFIKAVA